MALDKLVDSTQLNGALTATANAIRAKTGDSGTITWNSSTGFANAISDIQTGGRVVITDTQDSHGGTIKTITTSDSPIVLQEKTGIIPGISSITVTPDNGYNGMTSVQINGDANLVPVNIAKNISIFGVTGTLDINIVNALIEKTISGTYENINVTTIGKGAFAFCSNLTSVNFPACTKVDSYAFSECQSLTTATFPVCTEIGSYAFFDCLSLTTISFPACTTIYNNAFGWCSNLISINFPVCTSIYASAFSYCSSLTTVNIPSCISIGQYAFYSCANLTSVNFPECKLIYNYAFGSCYNLTTASFSKVTTIYYSAFRSCYNLISLYLMNSSVAYLYNSSAFDSTPIGGYTTSTNGVYGSIYVPASLLAAYQSSTNWVYFSSRMVGI